METITMRQKEILDFIKGYVESTNLSPTLREIGDALGISATTAVGKHLKILKHKGYIERDPGMSRSIRIKEDGEPVVYLSFTERRTQILDAALVAARQRGHYLRVRRADISDPLNVTRGLVTHYLGTAAEMQDAIMRHAVERKAVDVLAQGLLAGNPVALRAPGVLQRAAAKLLK